MSDGLSASSVKNLAITFVTETARSHNQKPRHYICSRDSEINRKLINAFDHQNAIFWQIENSSMHLTISSSNAIFWQKSKIRQCIWSFQRQMQFFDKIVNSPMHLIVKVQSFWHHRKFVSASDRFNVRCSLLTISKTRQCIWHISVKCSFDKTHQTFKQHLINISFNISNQHFSSTNIISAKTTSARTKYESDYISFSSIIIFFSFFLHVSTTNQTKEDYKKPKKNNHNDEKWDTETRWKCKK